MTTQPEALRLAEYYECATDLHSIQTAAELRRLHATLERERMRLVACGVVALADTPDSAKHARQMHPDYESASCQDVARRVDECISLRAQRDALLEALTELVGKNERFTGGVWDRARAAIKQAEENT